MKQIILVIVMTFFLMPVAVIASNERISENLQFNGPVNLTTVDSLLDDNSVFTKRNAIIDGYIIRQISISSFIFFDGKREIKIEISDKVRLSQSIDESTNLRIFGKFEGGNTPEIEVDHIHIL
ncbi:YgiW/YdeI family stress tolerance OB fold protein [Vibrio hepatarius]|uniref:YgiW/YdeI family stress tolerance OB fold protein n=1 Tax=Vibrio hepatarius TaxID=171383 RepID=UPI001C08F10E|nr:NirD/YgiW/YdeI family stress tolerance protein [Vibrio hepatarius]MBU2895149.1 NirD/YgiW/YdeI family stress tolerance protein [Vibrio hepatarius]